MSDVIIVGGGPVGSTAARICAKAGLSTRVLEEHASIGYPVQCAGLLSNNAFAECEVSARSVYNLVRGAKICGSEGHSLSFDAKTTKAYVVDRGRLDYEMAVKAAEAGAEFSLKTCVTKINPAKKIIYTARKEEIPYDLLIAADGPRSVVARSLGIPPSPFIYSGIQAEVPWDGDPSLVELHPNSAPEFFAWVIPLSESRARVGLCGTKNVPDLFAKFLSRFTDSNIHSVTGTIPFGIRNKTSGSGCMLIGDAAGFPKPTSGGGIYTGVRSARHAAQIAIESNDAGNTTDLFLSRYEALCRDDFGRELDMGLKALQFRRNLTSEDIDSAIDALNTPENLDLITRYGDMDHPFDLLKRLAVKPELYGIFGKIGVKGIFRLVFRK